MSNHSTLATDGLFTRFGPEITNFQGFGHAHDRENNNWYWFFTADLVGKEDDGREYRLESRKVFMDQVCCNVVDGGPGYKNMNALSKACMDYLHEHGEFAEQDGVWRAKAA